MIMNRKTNKWLQTNETIGDQSLKFFAEHKRMPSNEDLAKLTGLNVNTISRHQKGKPALLSNAVGAYKSTFMNMGAKYTMALINQALKGNLEAIKICFNLGFDYNITPKINFTGNVNHSLNGEIISKVQEQELSDEEKTERALALIRLAEAELKTGRYKRKVLINDSIESYSNR